MTDIAGSYLSRTLTDGALANDSPDTSTDRDLALKLFSGAVLDAFRQKTVFYDNTGSFLAQRTLTGGDTAQWPVIGDDLELWDIGTGTDSTSPADGEFESFAADGGLKAGYHTPGEFIKGRKVNLSEKNVIVDDMLVAAIDVPFIDLDLMHFDVLQPFATKLGRSLAIDNDRKIATIARKAAIAGDETGVYKGGQQVYRSGNATVNGTYEDNQTGSGLFRADVAQLAQAFDDDHVPEDGRYLFISPYIRRILRHEGTGWAIATDHAGSGSTQAYGPAGNPYSRDQTSRPWDVNTRSVGMLEGFNLVMTTSLPGAAPYGWTGTTGGRYALVNSERLGKYDFICDGTVLAKAAPAAIALCGAQEGNAAVGMVQAAGMRTVVQDDERRNVKFLKSQMLVGYDVLSPWCAGIIGVHAA